MEKFKLNEVVSYQGNFYTIIGIGRRNETIGKYLIDNFAFQWYHLIWVNEEEIEKVFEQS